jgi:hypothetical protein
MTTHSPKSRRSLLALAALAVFAVTGCSDSVSPGEDFDAVLTGQAASGIYEAIESNEAVQSLSVLGEHFPQFAASPMTATLPTAPWNPGDWSAARLSALQALPFDPTVAEVLFPANYLGTTWVYNTVAGAYEIAPDSTDAPADGVRISLYAVDPLFHEIVDPLTYVGYVELTDVSTPSADAVRIEAVMGSTTVLDYVASASVTTSTVTFSADGFVSDGLTTVNFELSVSLTPDTEQATIDYLIYVGDENPSVHLVVNADGLAGTLSVVLTVVHGEHTVVFNVSGSETAIAGTVTHNGALVVEISGNGDNPVFEDGQGNPLTGEQLHALAEMFESVFGFLDSFDHLLVPAFLVLQIPAYAL